MANGPDLFAFDDEQAPESIPPAAKPQKSRVADSVVWTAFRDPLPAENSNWYALGVLGAVLLIVMAFLSASAGGLPPKVSPAITLPFILLSFVMMACGFYLAGSRKRQVAHRQMDEFLKDNHWQQLDGGSKDDVATTFVGAGHDGHVTSQIIGQYKGRRFAASEYSYETGGGKTETDHLVTMVHFKLGKKFPLVLLDDTQNDTWDISNLPVRLPGGTRLQVEGNFNQRYHVTVLPGTEQTVLEWLTPDLMAELLDSNHTGDVEIEADSLFVINGSKNLDEKTLRDLFGVADVVLKHIDQLSDSWQASSSQSSVEAIADKALTPRKILEKHGYTNRRYLLFLLSAIVFTFLGIAFNVKGVLNELIGLYFAAAIIGPVILSLRD